MRLGVGRGGEGRRIKRVDVECFFADMRTVTPRTSEKRIGTKGQAREVVNEKRSWGAERS
jgi:hypothetical protein